MLTYVGQLTDYGDCYEGNTVLRQDIGNSEIRSSGSHATSNSEINIKKSIVKPKVK